MCLVDLLLEMCLVFFANIVEIDAGSYVGAPTWRLAHLLWSSVLKRRGARSPPLYPPNPSLDRLSPLLIHTPQLPGQPTYSTGRSFELREDINGKKKLFSGIARIT